MTRTIWVVYGINEANDFWCIHAYNARPTKATMEDLDKEYNVRQNLGHFVAFSAVELEVEDVS